MIMNIFERKSVSGDILDCPAWAVAWMSCSAMLKKRSKVNPVTGPTGRRKGGKGSGAGKYYL